MVRLRLDLESKQLPSGGSTASIVAAQPMTRCHAPDSVWRLGSIGDTVPVVGLNESVDDTATELASRLNPGEAQAFAVADIHDGTLVTDDGPARTLARDADVAVTGSIGLLIRAVDDNRLSEPDADRWPKQWIDETDYRAPSRDFSD